MGIGLCDLQAAALASSAVEPCLCKARVPEEYVDRNLQSIFT